MSTSKFYIGDFLENNPKSYKKLEEMPTIKEETIEDSVIVEMQEQEAFIEKKVGGAEEIADLRKKLRCKRNKKRYEATKSVFSRLEENRRRISITNMKNNEDTTTAFHQLKENEEAEREQPILPSWRLPFQICTIYQVVFVSQANINNSTLLSATATSYIPDSVQESNVPAAGRTGPIVANVHMGLRDLNAIPIDIQLNMH
ncbi:hypothetical protein GWI33_013909 [Rhynchophorus ferrugineus]|uniref:Uncharacterized protein n=1 Tax=Rhynchophorus ferrugineus TaxID=354439 RepID=A0A834I654_RHYFE|nr:hypothetical protein GWI33_013909 [Rhynchophorus ferrugineus]